jgi:hypothetical protein
MSQKSIRRELQLRMVPGVGAVLPWDFVRQKNFLNCGIYCIDANAIADTIQA